jgi:hypothetical protein
MRFTVCMKCPDELDRAIEEAAENEIGGPVDSLEHDRAFQDAVDKAKAAASKWFKFGECIRVTVDTEDGACFVEPA